MLKAIKEWSIILRTKVSDVIQKVRSFLKRQRKKQNTIDQLKRIIDEINKRTKTIMASMTEVLEKIAAVATAVDTLEAKITKIIKEAGVPAAVQVQIDEAFATLGKVVDDAADNVDEADVPPTV